MKQTPLLRKLIASVMVLSIAAISSLNAAVIPTYDGTSGGWWNLNSNGGSAIQWFTVPDGEVGIQFEFYLEKGTYNQPAAVNIAIYSVSNVLQKVQSTLATDFSATGMWVPVEDLELAPGQYRAVAWTNNEGFRQRLHAYLVDPSLYTDGYAASSDGRLPGEADFWARLTTEPIPEPVTPATTTGMFLIGGCLYQIMRRRKAASSSIL